MSSSSHATLKELQELDLRIAEVGAAIAVCDQGLEEVAGPAEALVRETEALQARLRTMQSDQRRLEGAADDKRARAKRVEERLNAVRNVREQAALQVELDMIRRATEADEQESLSLIDGIRRAEDQLVDLEARRSAAVSDVEPRRVELLREQAVEQERLAALEAEREAKVESLGAPERRLYMSYRSGGRKVFVVSLTPDGACGFCYSVVPLQIRSEVRASRGIIRCEACGVILSPPDPAQQDGTAE